MKELWIEINQSISSSIKDSLLKLATQVCDVILIDAKDVENARKTGVKIAASSGDCDIHFIEVFDAVAAAKLKSAAKPVAVRVTIKSNKDEETVVKAADLSFDYIILDCLDWKVIPLENLIAKTRGKSKLLVEVASAEDARLALETLELGADGVVLKTSDIDELMKTAAVTEKQALRVDLVPAKVVEVKRIGTGARVCVDTCDMMKPGEGILVGCQSSGLFLVEAEVHENPFVDTRPFRVNAGPVSLYTLSSLSKSKYLSELKAGTEILIVDRSGNTRLTNIARVKIEWRPQILVEAEFKGKRIKTIVQNAETIRLVTKDGSKSITELKVGDETLAHVTEGGRHFGTLVKEETVIER
jgi:3-dehydroquinate synthase II